MVIKLALSCFPVGGAVTGAIAVILFHCGHQSDPIILLLNFSIVRIHFVVRTIGRRKANIYFPCTHVLLIKYFDMLLQLVYNFCCCLFIWIFTKTTWRIWQSGHTFPHITEQQQNPRSNVQCIVRYCGIFISFHKVTIHSVKLH